MTGRDKEGGHRYPKLDGCLLEQGRTRILYRASYEAIVSTFEDVIKLHTYCTFIHTLVSQGLFINN
jgi:hypothetical protein